MMFAVHQPQSDPHDAPARAVLFGGGGTGGHIFPGIAIAERLESMNPSRKVVCVFAVSQRPLDAQILRDADRRCSIIPAQPLSLRPRGLFRFVASWGKSVRAARELIRELRLECPGGIDVMAMGGFVAGPVVQAARVERAPVSLVNLDAVPGRANRWIAGRSARIFSTVAVPQGSLPGKHAVMVVPPIVRAAARAPGDASVCRAQLGLDPHRRTLVVTGASQGAKSINSFMIAFAKAYGAVLKEGGWQIVHQTGKGESQRVSQGYDQAGVPALVREFFDGMGAVWGAGDVGVSRSGAGSVAEVWASAVPTVFLPYPYHKDQHQKFNALPVAESGAAVIAEDRIDPQANLTAVGPTLLDLVQNESHRAAMKAAFARLGPADGEERIAAEIMRSW